MSLFKLLRWASLPALLLAMASCGPKAPELSAFESEETEAISLAAFNLGFDLLRAADGLDEDGDIAIAPFEHLRLTWLLVNLSDDPTREKVIESAPLAHEDPISNRRAIHAMINDLPSSSYQGGSRFFLIWPMYTERIKMMELKYDLGADVYKLGSGRIGAQLRYMEWVRAINREAGDFAFTQDDFGFPATAANLDLRLESDTAHLHQSPGSEALILRSDDGAYLVYFAESIDELEIAINDAAVISEPIELPAVATDHTVLSEIALEKLWPAFTLGHLFEPPTDFKPLSTDLDENYHLTVGRSSTRVNMRNAPLGRHYFAVIERSERMGLIMVGRTEVRPH